MRGKPFVKKCNFTWFSNSIGFPRVLLLCIITFEEGEEGGGGGERERECAKTTEQMETE